MLLFKLILSSCAFFCVGCYRILGVFPAPSHSHFTLGFRLMKELVDRGHEVSFINSFPQENPIKNLRDISVEEIKEDVRRFYNFSELVDIYGMSYYSRLRRGSNLSRTMSRSILQHKNVRKLMKSNEKFDVVIMEHFLNDALFIFAHKFECPLILLTPGPPMMFNNYLFSNPSPPSYVKNLLTTYGSKMSFWERLGNTYQEILGIAYNYFDVLPMQNEILKEAYPDAPDLSTILYNASLMLTLSHPSLGDPVPLQHNIKEIGGYHILPPKDLPKELKDFMDSSTDGVVVFSVGSNLHANNFDPEKIKSILRVFSKLKQNVLWKFEEELPEMPENVKILRWLPQADILAHPNTVAFIYHGGLLGVTEAVYHGVPVLGIPFFWDQFRNIQNLIEKGMATRIDYNNFSERDFEDSLNKILNDPKYRNTAKKYSSIMRDNPLKPMDEAVFWIEYVVRHKGAPHLRSEAMDLRWYQLYSVDLVLFVVSIVVVVFTTLHMVFSCISRKRKVVSKEKKNK